MSSRIKHTRALRLGRLLIDHGISQSEVADVIAQPTGRPISRTAVNMLVNHDMWPASTRKEVIVEAVEAMLRDRGVPDELIATAWDTEPDPKQHLQPAFRRNGHVHTARHFGRQVPRVADDPEDPEIEPIGDPEMLFPETKKHFGLFVDPFMNDVQNAKDVFLAADQLYIREAMYATSRHGGFLAVVGESGSGKTTLFNDLHDRIEAERAKVIVASPSVLDVELDTLKTRLTSRRILECLLAATTNEVPRQSMQRLTDQVHKALSAVTSGESGHSVVLMVEEAHSLMPGTLKILKRLLELKAGHRYLLGVILIGQPELMDLLNESRHPELREVIRRCEVTTLMPLDANLEAYVGHKLGRREIKVANILAEDAFDAIRERLTMRNGKRAASQLYPLVVNTLLGKAMNKAAELGEDRVTADIIRAL